MPFLRGIVVDEPLKLIGETLCRSRAAYETLKPDRMQLIVLDADSEFGAKVRRDIAHGVVRVQYKYVLLSLDLADRSDVESRQAQLRLLVAETNGLAFR